LSEEYAMPVGAEFKAFVLDLLTPLRPTARRLFSGVGIMRDGIMFALLANDTMYFRVDDRTRTRFIEAGCTPFRYNRAGREVSMDSYYAVPDSLYDEPDTLLAWARDALDSAQRTTRKPRRRP
jgi:DNA transformation protein and related proteins